MCVVWIPLDDHSHEISLGLLRGSHRWGHRYRPERINGGWYEGYGEDDGFVSPPDVANHPEQYDILSWDMHVGDDAVYVEREQETQPSYAGNGLKPGDPIDNDYFPRLYPS